MARLEKKRYPWRWRDRADEYEKLAVANVDLPPVDWVQEAREEQAALEELLRRSQQLQPGQVVGAVLGWPRGYGQAFYLVTKGEPLTVQWIPYLDGYRVETAMIRGLRRVDVERILDRDRATRQVFGGKP